MEITKFNLELCEQSIVDIGRKACDLYGDVDMPVSSCIENYLIKIGFQIDDAFNFGHDLAEKYINLIYLGKAWVLIALFYLQF